MSAINYGKSPAAFSVTGNKQNNLKFLRFGSNSPSFAPGFRNRSLFSKLVSLQLEASEETLMSKIYCGLLWILIFGQESNILDNFSLSQTLSTDPPEIRRWALAPFTAIKTQHCDRVWNLWSCGGARLGLPSFVRFMTLAETKMFKLY